MVSSCYVDLQKALQQVLQWGQQGNVKEQICGVVRLLTSSIHQIHAVFYNPGSQPEEQGATGSDESISQDSCGLWWPPNVWGMVCHWCGLDSLKVGNGQPLVWP